MNPRRVVVLGAGQRVRRTILPALAALPDHWRLDGVFARSEKTVVSRGLSLTSESFDNLTAGRLDGVELVYLCVAKHAVPLLLRRLQDCDPGRIRLLIETPVLLFRQLGALPLLDAFASVHVSEDTSMLPWMETLALARGEGLLGAPRRVLFQRSAWRYHGLAMTRTLLDCPTLRRARRRRSGGQGARVTLTLTSGGVGEIVEPRDYASGHWLLTCAAPGVEGSGAVPAGMPEPTAAAALGAAGSDELLVTDAPDGPQGALRLQPLLDDGLCRGFRLGELTTALSAAESALLGPVAGGATVTSLTDRLKAIGLARLLLALHEGRPAYSLELGLDDMLVDSLLEKLGRWRPTPLTSLRSAAGRRWLPRALGLLARR